MSKLDKFAKTLYAALPSLSVTEYEPLSGHTSFAIGGPARLLAAPKSENELVSLYRLCLSEGVKPIFLGSGTNVLAPDKGLDALVILTRGVDEIEENNVIRAKCGATLSRLAQTAAKASLTGLEFAGGIPGTVGGGVLMNAGAYGGEIKDVCSSVRWLTEDGNIEIVPGAEAKFAYRESLFSNSGGLILSAEFALKEGGREEIVQKMADLAARRRASQPLDLPSAGSTFKRPAGGYAAALIDEAGLKGYRIGGAAVSEKHGGFVVNLGGATSEDVLALIDHIQKTVFSQTGVSLQPEVRILSD